MSIYVITVQYNLRRLYDIIFSIYVNFLRDISITIWIYMYVSTWEIVKNILCMEWTKDLIYIQFSKINMYIYYYILQKWYNIFGYTYIYTKFIWLKIWVAY